MQRKDLAITIDFQRTVTAPLTVCLSPGVHPTDDVPSLPPNLDNSTLVSSGVLGSSLGGESSLTAGVVGQSDVGIGVYGISQNGGVLGVTTGGAGVFGHGGGSDASPFSAVGVFGEVGGGDNNGVQGNGSGRAAGVAGFGQEADKISRSVYERSKNHWRRVQVITLPGFSAELSLYGRSQAY
jgi:hypothetical protein